MQVEEGEDYYTTSKRWNIFPYYYKTVNYKNNITNPD